MIKRERPRSAILERMGSDAIAEQICGVVEGNFRTLLCRARILRRRIWQFSREQERNITGRAVVITNGTGNEESLVLLFGVELAFGVHSLLTLVMRHTTLAWWLAEGYL